MRYDIVELGDFIDIYDSKRIPLSSIQRQKRQGKYPYYGASGVIDYIDDYIFDGDYLLVAEDGENLRSRNLPIVFWAKGKFWVNNHAHIILGKNGKADTDFIRHYLLNADISGYITGAAQPKLSQANLKIIKINLPSYPTQQKIASILSAYDDLIENNTRRIKILEEMAQTIYKEWFVNFRFPGHEKVKLVDSPLGKIPERWEIKDLREVANILMGQSPKSEFYNEEGIGLPFHQGVTDFGFRFPTHKIFCTVENRTAEKDDILFSVRAPVGRINVANTKLIIGRGLSAICHNANLQSYLLYLLKHTFTEEDTLGSGAIFNSVTKDDMNKIKVLKPANNIDEIFNKMIEPIDYLIENLNSKIINLRKTLDLLLPKLMSGEVEV